MGFISKIVTSKGYKIFMSRLYGWGASVVMIGALMKLEHFQYSSYFLIAGLGTEAIIFFFSAWEPSRTKGINDPADGPAFRES